MKKLIALILVLATAIFGGCAQKGGDAYQITARPEGFSYYASFKMNEQKHLKVFGKSQSLNNHQKTTALAIQGLFARDEITYFLNCDDQTDYWLSVIQADYGVTSEEVTLSSMIADYKAKFSDNGYILYDTQANVYSINTATTIAGVTGYLPIEKSLESFAIAEGLTQKLDVSEMTQKQCFDQYKDQLNNDVLVQINYDRPHLRDYAVANKYLSFYEDRSTNKAMEYRGQVHGWAKSDAPIFGWGPGAEDSHVGLATSAGQFTIPADFCYNTTVYSAPDFFKNDNLVRPGKNRAIEGQEGKHYVSIVRSDGDNIQTWYNYFPFSDKDMGAARGDFQMGWSIQPSLTDIAPAIIKDVYKKADKNDNFVCAVSGMGYMYPNQFPDKAAYMGSLDTYLKRADLDIVQILDAGPSAEVIEWYSRVPSLKAGIYMYGLKYSEGAGSIFWSKNGKPFVSFRETLWDTTGQALANKINSYPKNYKDISGYSLINLHPWSCDYGDVADMVAALGEDVVVVSPDQFMDLIIKNVPKENKILTK